MIHGGKAAFDSRADGSKHQDERQVEVSHESPADHTTLDVVTSDVEGQRMHHPATCDS